MEASEMGGTEGQYTGQMHDYAGNPPTLGIGTKVAFLFHGSRDGEDYLAEAVGFVTGDQGTDESGMPVYTISGFGSEIVNTFAGPGTVWSQTGHEGDKPGDFRVLAWEKRFDPTGGQ